MKHKHTFAAIFAVLLLNFSAAHSQTPSIKVTETTVKADQKAVSLKSLHAEVEIYGNIATTTITMSFKNTSSRVLEGELTFPMPEGVSISRYALDINGKMREAVPVEKARATEVFESIENRNVDPGLLEKVEGNNFRTRIYPFPANGIRTVTISYEEELHFSAQQQLSYHLPLAYKKAIPEFSLKASVLESNQKPLMSEQPDGSFNFTSKGKTYTAEMKKQDFLPAHGLVINLPAATEKNAEQTTALMQKAGQSYYFLSNVFVKAPVRTRRWSKRIGLLWDVSLSGLQRDTKKEMALLDGFIKEQKNLTIELGLLNNTFNKSGVFIIKDGNWNELKEKLSKLVYDGGTDYSKINPGQLNAEEYLFFTDGFSGFGNSAITLNKPVYTINSALRADYSNLNFISSKTGGQFVNLNTQSAQSALKQLSEQELQFIGLKNNTTISELYPALFTPVNGYISIAGITSAANETLTLQFGYGKEVTLERKVKLNAEDQNSGIIDVSKVWAQKKLAVLDINYDKNKEEISLLGKQFGLVTRNTSLIVLESVEDYVRYEIEPPNELRAAYDQQIKITRQGKENRQQGYMKEAIAMAAELKTWWNTIFKPEKTYPKPDKTLLEERVAGVTVSPAREASERSQSDLAETVIVMRGKSTVTKRNNAVAGRIAGAPVANGGGRNESADMVATSGAEEQKRTVIIVPEFKSDKDYMKKISGSPDEAYQEYLSVRKEYLTTPSFYLDISNWFQQHSDASRALMILSNLTELELENADIYKTLTYKLRETGNVKAELFTSRKILEWRPMDAQSYRDYALALASNGQYQQALDTLYSVLNQNYSLESAQRDRGIEEVILAEINYLITLHSAKLNTRKIDKKVIFSFPVDVRVVMNWNKKNTDIDLWVTDPNGEKCYYGMNRTKAGGRMSRDITQGYGPEQFMLKKAVKGTYKIEVNYFGDNQVSISGPTTVMAEIYTNYGTAKQERKIIALQLAKEKQGAVFIGEFTF